MGRVTSGHQSRSNNATFLFSVMRKVPEDVSTVWYGNSTMSGRWSYRRHPWPNVRSHAFGGQPFPHGLCIAYVVSICCREIGLNHIFCYNLFIFVTSTPTPPYVTRRDALIWRLLENSFAGSCFLSHGHDKITLTENDEYRYETLPSLISRFIKWGMLSLEDAVLLGGVVGHEVVWCESSEFWSRLKTSKCNG